MKLFQVVFERDGLTVKAPGISETELKRETTLYAANDVSKVIKAIQPELLHPEKTFISISEVAPMVTILK